MVGGPVRDREWAVPMWAGGIIGQDYPHERMSLAVLVNDSRDGTLDACYWWADAARQAGFWYSNVANRSFGCQVDNNARRHRDFLQFARVRDAWVAMRLSPPAAASGSSPERTPLSEPSGLAPEWLLQVDSDVQLPADTLRRLVELATESGARFLAACIQNAWGGPLFAGNVMKHNAFVDGLAHFETFLTDRDPGVKPCELTGAVALLHRSIFDAGIKYEQPGIDEDTEDGPFCRACVEAGFQPHYAPSIWATHWMQAPVSTAYLADPEYHQRLADWHTAEACRLAGLSGEFAERTPGSPRSGRQETAHAR